MFILGDLLMDNATPRYSDWESRQGDRAVFALEVIASSVGVLFQVTVQTKNSEDVDSAASTVAAFAPVSAAGRFTKYGTGVKELVRYKYEVTIDFGMGPDWVHFRMLPSAWFPN